MVPGISDDTLLDFGRFRGRTFAEVMAAEPAYCRWVVDRALDGQPVPVKMLSFALHLQTRALRREATAERRAETEAGKGSNNTDGVATMGTLPQAVRGRTGCLADRRFVLTGEAPGVSRVHVEAMICHFGGEIRSAVSSKTSYLVILGEKLRDYKGSRDAPRPVKASQKCQAAESRGIPILTGLEALVQIITSSGEGAEDELSCFQFGSPTAA